MFRSKDFENYELVAESEFSSTQRGNSVYSTHNTFGRPSILSKNLTSRDKFYNKNTKLINSNTLDNWKRKLEVMGIPTTQKFSNKPP